MQSAIENTIPTGEGLTFEKVWAMFQETGRKMQETDRQIKRLNRQMGGLHNKFGKIAEHLVAPGITKRFNELGYHFDTVATKGATIYGENGKVIGEIDILLENGEFVIAVEVKTEPRLKDIEHHIKRLELLCERKKFDGRKIRGAIAGAIFGTEVKEATLEAGMYVIEQSGDTMKLEIPDVFVPREW